MPVPTLAEVLKQSGWTQDQIDALDAQARTGLNSYVTNIYQTAEQKEQAALAAAQKAEEDRKAQEAATAAAVAAQEAAELNVRQAQDFWANVYPAANAEAEAEKARLAKEAADAKAEAAYYKAQRESYLGTLGIDPSNAPVFTPPPAPVVDQNKTPGTPTFSEDAIMKRLDQGVHTIQDIGWKYQQLYGTPIPISPSQLVSEADRLKLSPMEYAARTFKFAEKEAEHRAAEAKKHDDEIAAKTAAEKESEWKAKMDAQAAEFSAKERKMAEQISSHPDMHLPPGSARVAEIKRAVSAGERPDPTKMTPEARLKLTQQNVIKRFEEQRQTVAA
jgi:hypothetical protein